MGTLASLSLCLITLFSLASCSSTSQVVTTEKAVARAPFQDSRFQNTKILNQRYIVGKN